MIKREISELYAKTLTNPKTYFHLVGKNADQLYNYVINHKNDGFLSHKYIKNVLNNQNTWGPIAENFNFESSEENKSNYYSGGLAESIVSNLRKGKSSEILKKIVIKTSGPLHQMCITPIQINSKKNLVFDRTIKRKVNGINIISYILALYISVENLENIVQNHNVRFGRYRNDDNFIKKSVINRDLEKINLIRKEIDKLNSLFSLNYKKYTIINNGVYLEVGQNSSLNDMEHISIEEFRKYNKTCEFDPIYLGSDVKLKGARLGSFIFIERKYLKNLNLHMLKDNEYELLSKMNLKERKNYIVKLTKTENKDLKRHIKLKGVLDSSNDKFNQSLNPYG